MCTLALGEARLVFHLLNAGMLAKEVEKHEKDVHVNNIC